MDTRTHTRKSIPRSLVASRCADARQFYTTHGDRPYRRAVASLVTLFRDCSLSDGLSDADWCALIKAVRPLSELLELGFSPYPFEISLSSPADMIGVGWVSLDAVGDAVRIRHPFIHDFEQLVAPLGNGFFVSVDPAALTPAPRQPGPEYEFSRSVTGSISYSDA